MISRDKRFSPEQFRSLVDDLQMIIIARGTVFRDLRGVFRLHGPVDLVTVQDPFEAGILGLLISYWFGARLQVQVHTDFLNPLYRIESFRAQVHILLAAFVLARASCVRVVSERVRRSIIERGFLRPGVQVSVLPAFVDLELLARAGGSDLHSRYPNFETIFLMASRLTREKNIGLAIRALSPVVRQHPRVGLVVVGEGPEREELERVTQKAGVRDNVVFEPWRADVADLFRSADAFVLTSNYEGYGRTLVQAAAARCPMITTDVGLVGELIDRDDALVVPPGDESALVSAMMRIAGSAPLRVRLAEKAYHAVRALPARAEYMRQFRELWDQCCVIQS